MYKAQASYFTSRESQILHNFYGLLQIFLERCFKKAFSSAIASIDEWIRISGIE